MQLHPKRYLTDWISLALVKIKFGQTGVAQNPAYFTASCMTRTHTITRTERSSSLLLHIFKHLSLTSSEDTPVLCSRLTNKAICSRRLAMTRARCSSLELTPQLFPLTHKSSQSALFTTSLLTHSRLGVQNVVRTNEAFENIFEINFLFTKYLLKNWKINISLLHISLKILMKKFWVEKKKVRTFFGTTSNI